MKHVTGILRKMQAELGQPIDYQIRLSDEKLPINEVVGGEIALSFTGNIYCTQCERKISKSFQQGYCYPCYRRLLECNLCIIHPERCNVEHGTCPKDDWAHAHCHQSHVIYLSNTSGLKVGITRETQVPTRWIDQGAVQAVPIMKVSNRFRSGVVEVALKAFLNDKTNWRAMLKNDVELCDLAKYRDELMLKIQQPVKEAAKDFYDDIEWLREVPTELNYPVQRYPDKVKSLSLDKTPEIEATLEGIKGQYLLLNHGVINLRKFGGYEVKVSV